MSVIEKIKQSHPKYPVKIPSTGENTFFRPFLMKEQKNLLLAQEENKNFATLKAITSVVEDCVDSVESALTIPMQDLEYLFCQIRAKSVSEIAEPSFTCPVTGESIKTGVNLEEVKITKDTSKSEIKIKDNITIHLRHPVVQDFFVSGTENLEDQLISQCISKIVVDDEVYEGKNIEQQEKLEILESLTKAQYDKVLNFFEKQPTVYHDVKYRTTDGVIRTLKLSGVYDFFG